MAAHPRPLAQLIRELARLPGIGPRSAERLAFFMLSRPRAQSEALLLALGEALSALVTCATCFGVSESERCAICSDPARDASQVLVVEDAKEIHTLEKASVFKGLYHVLGGVISPLEGVGPDDLTIAALVTRAQSSGVTEVVLALDLDPEGESTASYLSEALRPTGVKVSRLAQGLPSGAQVGFADPVTLAGAFASRRPC